ncbi:WYL domain-containing protein [Endozoicomonas sp. SESOKO1]|uniref:transcriptional regulator n=1 Tax=Endozoicomonas sp. SESOKO1 TaxID=2828742 RepID=UPI002147DDC1|nr:WYL domain-containing protein [Endozoicomonas sp. SESOKO1]
MSEDTRTLQQFKFIELLLAYEGQITNQQIREKFGISSVQASRILASYREAYPRNTQKQKGQGRGRYVPTARFTPEVTNLSVESYFKSAGTEFDNVLIEDIRQDFTIIPPPIFREIRKAVSTQSAVKILYRSMSHPGGAERIIHPHSFVFAGRRWHVRAFDEKSEEYRDFNLARIWKAESTSSDASPSIDIEWEEKVQLELRPHPLLTPEQVQLIRDELFKGATGRRVTTRRALVRYVLRELEAAEDPETQIPPEYQVYLYRTE